MITFTIFSLKIVNKKNFLNSFIETECQNLKIKMKMLVSIRCRQDKGILSRIPNKECKKWPENKIKIVKIH